MIVTFHIYSVILFQKQKPVKQRSSSACGFIQTTPKATPKSTPKLAPKQMPKRPKSAIKIPRNIFRVSRRGSLDSRPPTGFTPKTSTPIKVSVVTSYNTSRLVCSDALWRHVIATMTSLKLCRSSWVVWVDKCHEFHKNSLSFVLEYFKI